MFSTPVGHRASPALAFSLKRDIIRPDPRLSQSASWQPTAQANARARKGWGRPSPDIVDLLQQGTDGVRTRAPEAGLALYYGVAFFAASSATTAFSTL